MVYKFREFYIPDRMMHSLRRYIDEYCPVGDFLTAVLHNDLGEAVGRADPENLTNLSVYVAFLHNEAPRKCYGSRERVTAWLEEGRKKREEADGKRQTAKKEGEG